MDQIKNFHKEKSYNPPKIIAFLALILAIALPFILVKLFLHKKTIPLIKEQIIKKPKILHETYENSTKEKLSNSFLNSFPSKLVPIKTEQIKPQPIKNPWITVKTREKDTLSA